MKAPPPPAEVVREHPNATFVLGTTPFAALLGWILSLRGVTMPPELATSVGGLVASAALVFARYFKAAGRGIWDYGIVGCCHRLWKGRPQE